MSSFRRSTVLRAVVLWLVVLGASSLTAPFSTFSFVSGGHNGSATEALRTVDHSRPGFDKLLVLPFVLARSLDSRRVGILLSTSHAALRADSVQHDILRV